MKEQLCKLIEVDGFAIIHREWDNGFVTIGRALTVPDGQKIVEELNRMTALVNEQKTALRDAIIREVTDAIESNFMDVD